MPNSDDMYGDIREIERRLKAERKSENERLKAMKATAKAQKIREKEDKRRKAAEEKERRRQESDIRKAEKEKTTALTVKR